MRRRNEGKPAQTRGDPHSSVAPFPPNPASRIWPQTLPKQTPYEIEAQAVPAPVGDNEALSRGASTWGPKSVKAGMLSFGNPAAARPVSYQEAKPKRTSCALSGQGPEQEDWLRNITEGLVKRRAVKNHAGIFCHRPRCPLRRAFERQLPGPLFTYPWSRSYPSHRSLQIATVLARIRLCSQGNGHAWHNLSRGATEPTPVDPKRRHHSPESGFFEVGQKRDGAGGSEGRQARPTCLLTPNLLTTPTIPPSIRKV